VTTPEPFERLEGAVLRIARHADTPEKPDAVVSCLFDIKGRFEQGTLSLEQTRRLLADLLAPPLGLAERSSPCSSATS
jgi:hypothetical protein